MKSVKINMGCHWTCILLTLIPVLTITMLVLMRPPLLMTICNPVEYNSSIYQDICDKPMNDDITLFCIVSRRCHFNYSLSISQSTSMLEACKELDYHMDCDWVQLEDGQWSSE
jgi:hypothetical protein